MEAAGIQLPAGAARTCSACVAKLVSGEVDQSEQSFCAQLEAGYTVTCVAYPLSDCTLQTHQEKDINRLFIRCHHNLPTHLPALPYHLCSE